jgi:hypothetical protein
LTGKTIERRRLGTPRRRWKVRIRTALKEIGVIVSNWVDWSHDRDYWRYLVFVALNLRVP